MNFAQIPLYFWAIIILGLVSIIQFVLIASLSGKIKKFQKAYTALQTFLDGSSLDQQLKEYLKEVKQIHLELDNLEKRTGLAESKLRASVDRTELIRFSAFENMGSELSFALAMLNQEGNGVVLSSINNRDESRVYAKPIVNGESTYNLSEEEKRVINKARETIRV